LRQPDDSKDRHEEEVAILLPLFHDFVISVVIHEDEWESLEALMEARADIAIRRACVGFGIDFEEALRLIRAVAEEYQMADDMAELEELLTEEEEMEDEDWFEFYLPVFSKFHDQYMRTENMDIEYSMIIAAYLSTIREDTVLMYMTQGDERVRPWHLQYEGFTAPKSRFPAWLIPPIEHQCRCYLIEDTETVFASIKASTIPEMPDWFNRTFKESVALGGRIFSDEHPYFQVDERHVGRLNAIAKRIKAKYLEDGEEQ